MSRRRLGRGKTTGSAARLAAGALAFWLWGLAPAHALSDPEAVEVMKAVYERGIQVQQFEADLQIYRADRDFLALFFPDDPVLGPVLTVKGVLNCDLATRQFNLYLQTEGIHYLHFSADQAASLAFKGYRRIYGSLRQTDPGKRRVEAVDSEPVRPFSLREPSQSPTAHHPGRASYPRLTPQSARPVDNHPLSFLFPYVMRSPDPRDEYLLKRRKVPAYGRDCYLVEVRKPGGVAENLWISHRTYQVIRVAREDPETGGSLEAGYTSFHPPDEKTGFALYNHVEVAYDGHTLFSADLVNPAVNEGISRPRATPVPKPSPERPPPAVVDLPVDGAWLSQGLLVVVLLLCLALAVLLGRYLRFLLSRQEFSEELIVIDEVDGTFSALLEEMGYPVVAFGPDILTSERHRVGKRATADTTYRPRAVVVAPESFSDVRSHFYLLRAYVEEGGRVLVMHHGPDTAQKMPITAELERVDPRDPDTLFEVRTGPWQEFLGEEMERYGPVAASPHIYTKVDGRRPDRSILAVQNRRTGISGAAVAVVPRGKGEYLLCQLRLEGKAGTPGSPAGTILRNLIAYLQARTTAERRRASVS